MTSRLNSGVSAWFDAPSFRSFGRVEWPYCDGVSDRDRSPPSHPTWPARPVTPLRSFTEAVDVRKPHQVGPDTPTTCSAAKWLNAHRYRTVRDRPWRHNNLCYRLRQ